MSEEYDRLIADITVSALGVVPATIDAELMITTRDFLQTTSAWKQDFEMSVYKDRTCYVLQPPRGAAIHLLFNVFDAKDPDQRPVWTGGINMSVPGHIELAGPPSADALWVATVSLYPVAASEGSAASCKGVVPGFILHRYYDTLMRGVLSRLQMQPLKGYTNPQMALVNQKLYREGRSTARADLARSHVWGTQQWRFPGATTATSRQRGA